MSMRKTLGTIRRGIRGPLTDVRWSLLSSLQRQEYVLPDRGPIVSFTFDDFPRSALEVGGTILRSCGAYGTYYAAMGLMGSVSRAGECFCAEDLKHLLADGHELGSHTFSHLSCRKTPLEVFQADAGKGREAVCNVTGSFMFHHFAYPFGEVTMRAKHRVGLGMTSCRGVLGGINVSSVDLHLLRANRLYNESINFGVIEHLFRINDRLRGWLIFYTHDVRDEPSPWGCTPGQLEKVVRLATRLRTSILTVGDVLQGLPGSTKPNGSDASAREMSPRLVAQA